MRIIDNRKVPSTCRYHENGKRKHRRLGRSGTRCLSRGESQSDYSGATRSQAKLPHHTQAQADNASARRCQRQRRHVRCSEGARSRPCSTLGLDGVWHQGVGHAAKALDLDSTLLAQAYQVHPACAGPHQLPLVSPQLAQCVLSCEKSIPPSPSTRALTRCSAVRVWRYALYLHVKWRSMTGQSKEVKAKWIDSVCPIGQDPIRAVSTFKTWASESCFHSLDR